MNNPLHAPYYADRCEVQSVTVTQRTLLARDTYLIRIECPEIAARITPGQFVMVRLPNCCEPLLGRAFALYDVKCDGGGHAISIELVFFIVGKITARLAELTRGARLEVWGPLGNGFLPRRADHLVMVAGGIGQTPFLALAKEYLGLRTYGTPPRHVPKAEHVTLCYGTRSADLLAGVEDFRALDIDVRIATDDGSRGHHGLVTEVLTDVFASTQLAAHVVCCGPEPMMKAVATLCADQRVPCEVSLETPMACGLGICFSCVTRIRDERGQWDYERTCVAGPVFDAAKIVW